MIPAFHRALRVWPCLALLAALPCTGGELQRQSALPVLRSPDWLGTEDGCLPPSTFQNDLAALTADRAAIERVYYQHRAGTKPPFEQGLRPEELRRMVATDLAKEAALKQRYNIEIAPAEVEAEVARIERTTRAPEVLAEIKAALGGRRGSLPSQFHQTIALRKDVARALRKR